MFPEIRDFIYPTREEADEANKKLLNGFLNKGFLEVNEYYEITYTHPIPEEAHLYFWPSQSYFLFGRDELGWHIVALDPIKVDNKEE